MTDCPVCDCKNINGRGGDTANFDCPRCGEFWLTGTALSVLPGQLAKGIHRAAIMSHALRRTGSRSVLGSQELDGFWNDERLPPASKQADDLILWAGDNQLSPDTYQRCASYFLGAWIGTTLVPIGMDRHQGLFWVLTYLDDEGLLESRPEADDDPMAFNPVWGLRLTMRGWERYSQLTKTRSDSRTAFMAMKFGDSVLDAVVDDHFKHAVLRAGFEH